MKRLILSSAAILVALSQTARAAVITVDDPGFENSYNGQPTAWVFSSTPADSLRYNGAMDSHPFDNTCIYFEGTAASWMVYQVITGFETGTATVSLFAEGRNTGGEGQYGPNPLVITMNGLVLTFNGSNTITPELGYMSLYTSDAFSVTAGVSYTLAISGTIPYEAGVADKTSFVDNVSIENTAIPEPGTLAMVFVGAVGVAALRWRRKGSASKVQALVG